MKKSFLVSMKVKESSGDHLTLIDRYRNVDVENAIMILSKKYYTKTKKSFLERITMIFPEIDKEIRRREEKRK